MKVHLYGNVLNNSYYLTKFLRAKGIEAEMFLDNSSKLQQDFPWWEDAELSENNLPPWVHYYRVNPNFLFPQRELRRLINDFSKCDVALVCGYGPIIASKAKIPFCFYSFGMDIVITRWMELFVSACRNIFHFKKPIALRALMYASFMQREALQKADRICIGMGYQVNTYVKPLGLLPKMKKVRPVWDVELYSCKQKDKMLHEKYKNFDVVYFMVSRHSWKSVWNDLKGNDKFIRAYAEFVKRKKPNVLLILIEKGGDVKESKKLISHMKIDNYVEWVPEMNKENLRSYYSLDNVIIVDSFWHDKWNIKYPRDNSPKVSMGTTCMEALSAGKPLITSFTDADFYENEYPPILSAFSEKEIYMRLVESIEMGVEGRNALGQKGYEFVKKYNGWQNAIYQYIDVLKEIVENKKGGKNHNSVNAKTALKISS